MCETKESLLSVLRKQLEVTANHAMPPTDHTCSY